jgi:hypothetical protein
MSTLDDAFGDPDRSALSRALTRSAHLLPWVLAVLMPARVVIAVTPAFSTSWWPLPVVVSGYLLLPLALFHQGLSRLCVRCMSEVPTDPGRQVQRWRLLLWWSHRPLLVVAMAPAAAAAVVTLTAWLTTGHITGHPAWVWLPVDAAFFLHAWSVWVHHRLRPWCPYCRRWDDGGAREPSPDPVRDGVKS